MVGILEQGVLTANNKEGGLKQMTTQTEQTIGQWLEELVAKDSSTDTDSNKMQNLLHRLGFPQAVCTLGIVYLDGHGTIDAPPTDIHSIARMLVTKAHKS